MKLKRIGALFTALALALTMTAAATEPEENEWSFTDIANHWAREDIQAMHDLKLSVGYPGGDGTYYFSPDSTMTALEALLFFTRIAGVEESVQRQIYEDLGEAVLQRIPSNYAWAAQELSVAVELGILSLDELEDLNQIAPGSVNSSAGPTSFLLWSIPREQVCMYLVRAMQLEDLAQSLSIELCASYLNSHFVDMEEITPAYRPYIYILRNYNILMGDPADDSYRAAPSRKLKRGETAALVIRVINFMESKGLYAEAFEYTTYPWAAGTIDEASSNSDGTVTLTLSSPITGAKTYILPSDVAIYDEYNTRGDQRELTSGQYARLSMDETTGEPYAVRLCGKLTVVEGRVVSYGDRSVTLWVEGASRTLKFSRFTQVTAGDATGDKSILETAAGYTNAVCYVDGKGTLVGAAFSGGTVLREGIISAVTVNTAGTTLSVTDTSGRSSSYVVSADARIVINEATDKPLSNSYVGRPVTLRVGETDKVVHSATVDTMTLYIQGPISTQSGPSIARVLTFKNALDNNADASATLSPSAVITYDGEERTSEQIENGWFATAKVEGSVITELTAYSATTKVEGVISGITFGTAVTTFTLEQADGGVQSYTLDMNDLPDITREGKNNALTQLRRGDVLTITLRYYEVEKIEAKAQEADLTGEILEINQGQGGMRIKIRLSDNTETVYTVSGNASVTKNGKALTNRDLSYGDRIAFVANGTELVSAEILTSSATTGETMLTGSVLSVDTRGNNRLIYLLIPGSDEPRTINVKNATVKDLNGRDISLISNGLKAGDTVTVFGTSNGAVFEAQMVVKTASASN